MRATEFIVEARGIKLDQDTIDLIKILWDEGKKRKAIAAYLGLSDAVVKNTLYRYHGDRQNRMLKPGHDLTIQDKNEIVSRFRNNDTVKNIAKDYSVDDNTVASILKNILGDNIYADEVEKRRNTIGTMVANKITPEMLIKMRELYAAGKTLGYIAGYFDNIIATTTVNAAMKRQPDYAEIRAKREENTRKVKHSPVATTAIHRPGTIDNQRSKGPQSRHTSGVNWPKYGE